MAQKKFHVLPGFGLTLGFTLCYLTAVVLIPFAALIIRACEISMADFWRLATTERALASYRLTFGASGVAAVVNALFGTLLAWVLVLAFTRGPADVLAYMPAVAWRSGTGMVTWNEMA